MENNVFISSVEIASANKFYKLNFKIFDKNRKIAYFSTSLMTKYNAEKYEKQALKLIGFDSWFGVVYGVEPPEFEIITDSEEACQIVGLAYKDGLLLKNEVKEYSFGI